MFLDPPSTKSDIIISVNIPSCKDHFAQKNYHFAHTLPGRQKMAINLSFDDGHAERALPADLWKLISPKTTKARTYLQASIVWEDLNLQVRTATNKLREMVKFCTR